MRLQPLNRFGRWGVFQQPARHRMLRGAIAKIAFFSLTGKKAISSGFTDREKT